MLSYLDKALSDNERLLRAEGCKDTKKKPTHIRDEMKTKKDYLSQNFGWIMTIKIKIEISVEQWQI